MTLSTEAMAEIAALRATERPTRRAVVPALEDILYEPLPVLVQGFVGWSTYGRRCGRGAGGARLLRQGHEAGQHRPGLINYLMRHAHDAVRDVRDQAAREAADLRGTPVDFATARPA
jgi:thymidylate synthase (FAD)